MTEINFPTELHEESVNIIKDFFLLQKSVDTILLVNSMARGKATAESDIDMAVLVSPHANDAVIKELEKHWTFYLNGNQTLQQYLHSNKFAQIHLDITDGKFKPAIWEDGTSVDFFELEIGNLLLYSLPMNGQGNYFMELKSKWLPYYDNELQVERLSSAKLSCEYELDHIPIYVNRGLYFQAFDRLYAAFQKFLMTLFLKHKTYPFAYNKWIKEQIDGLLKLPQLYKELPGIISVSNIESEELIEKAMTLKILLNQYC